MKRFCRTSLLSILALLCTLAVSACDGKADDGKTDEITITVTFRVDAATHATVEVKAGAAMPADPQKEGFTFVGWFLDEAELTQAFTSFTGITANVTVYAKWAPAGEGTPDAITVTFMADGATHATVEVKAGAAMPADPQKEGYTFAGWFLDNVTFSESFLNLTGITANVTVYAKWTIKAEEPLLVYTLINDGTAYEVTIRSGAAADAGEVVIPSLHEGKPVVSIGDNAFYGSALTGITLPNGIIRIGSNAFAYCASLSGITIPSSVTDIDDSAFSGCTSLSVTWNYNPDLTARSFTQLVKTVIIPDGVKNIGEWAFRDCGALANITIPSGVLSIGAVAFAGCSALTSITLPDSVLSIGDKAFEGCNALTSITLGNGVTQIGSDVFANCVKLTDITIPGSVSSIGYNDFYGFT
ncbi:MAG: leucine-rich repeat protein, partial [Firmicutes bacterium]|nr:leucine-rich repeat protein [Bacillota bacterium]